MKKIVITPLKNRLDHQLQGLCCYQKTFFETLLNFGVNVICTEFPAETFAIETNVNDACGEDQGRDLPEKGNSPDNETEMERVRSVLEALLAIFRVKRSLMVFDDQSISFLNQLRCMQT